MRETMCYNCGLIFPSKESKKKHKKENPNAGCHNKFNCRGCGKEITANELHSLEDCKRHKSSPLHRKVKG